jgi:hypothetical protein
MTKKMTSGNSYGPAQIRRSRPKAQSGCLEPLAEWLEIDAWSVKNMNLQMRRLVRTPSSEQFALFDLDQTDDEFDPLSIGKLDLHYTPDGAYGTFLLWKQTIEGVPDEQIHSLVQVTLQELCEPMGLPSFYAVEYFSPPLESYQLHSNEEDWQDASLSVAD